MNIASSLRMKEIDRISIEEKGYGDLLLMENAGIRILEAAERLTDLGDMPVVCVAGSGNNGGDALVIARQIFTLRSNPVTVLIVSENGSKAFEFHLALCRNLGIPVVSFSNNPESAGKVLNGAGVIFDGLSGTGIRGALREPASSIVEKMNCSGALMIAIDLPSGTGDSFAPGSPAVAADFTFTVGLPKRCLYLPAARPCCGRIETVSIGFPSEVLNDEGLEPDGRIWRLYDESDIAGLMPSLTAGDYKTSRGHLAVFAGSAGTTGAASLCAEAAIRTSAGLVSLFADETVYPVLAGRHRAVMVKPLDDPEHPADPAKFRAVAAGPGWGISAGRENILKRIINENRGVLDADAISMLAGMKNSGNMPDLGGRWILTPHPGEFRRLFPDYDVKTDPFEAVVYAAEQFNCIILLKGIVTFAASPDGRFAVIDGAYPKLGTAGSGDLLCGIIGGYASSGMDLFDAAVLGSLVHLRAAKACGTDRTWFSADELIDYIGRSI